MIVRRATSRQHSMTRNPLLRFNPSQSHVADSLIGSVRCFELIQMSLSSGTTNMAILKAANWASELSSVSTPMFSFNRSKITAKQFKTCASCSLQIRLLLHTTYHKMVIETNPTNPRNIPQSNGRWRHQCGQRRTSLLPQTILNRR